MGAGRPQEDIQERTDRAEAWLHGGDERIFDTATFKAYLSMASLKFAKDGQLLVSLVIPIGSVDDALPLRFLARNPLPLEVTITVHPDFTAKVEEDNRKLALFSAPFPTIPLSGEGDGED